MKETDRIEPNLDFQGRAIIAFTTICDRFTLVKNLYTL